MANGSRSEDQGPHRKKLPAGVNHRCRNMGRMTLRCRAECLLSLRAWNGCDVRLPRCDQRFGLCNLIRGQLFFSLIKLGSIKFTAMRGGQPEPHISLYRIVRKILTLQVGHAKEELSVLHSLVGRKSQPLQ